MSDTFTSPFDVHGHRWVQKHADDCPIVAQRAALLDDLLADPRNPYLQGAVPEYDEGGDQEAEGCTCGGWHGFRLGMRVALVHDIDRFPHFIAKAGAVGEVVYVDVGTLAVRMDEHVPGAEDWNNEVVWSLRDGDNPRGALARLGGRCF